MKGVDYISTIIRVVGANCQKGIKLAKNIKKAISNEEVSVLLNETDNSLRNRYGIKAYPGLIINGVLISEGKVLTERQIKELLAFN